ncbi:hypothetical protein I2485_06915 [Nesterenkonia sp. E16_7]|uniref:hypothetical protein n=1 Tax=unclassified Nesterenkonia TaxID=2629769 RepID=UPI001A92AA42|nr:MULTISPECIES: hypothetical protein [unclassified Nesterenkonia]MBO0596607.1 hypothetical protein [Nesterenkonia sp. E16_10]MBO0598383.1 hypothetical protein [Nesterenkonia sp. E16_7]
MNDSPTPSTTRIPNAETDTGPDFREGPAELIRAAVKADHTVNLVLNGAQRAIVARTDKFTQDLGVEAVRVAGLRRASAVDVPDVDNAWENLHASQRDSHATWIWAVLGIVAGAAISFLITVFAPTLSGGMRTFAIIVTVAVLLACAGIGYGQRKKQT